MKRALSVLFPYAVFAVLSLISWNRWIEPYVDTGRELMVPWRLSRGEALYRDVRFYYGPLGPILAAGTDSIAGRSLPARIALAAVVALAHIEALRRLASRFLGDTRGGFAAALAVALFFFLRPGGCHLFPYSLDTAIAVAAATWTLVLAGAAPPFSFAAIAAAILASLLSRPETGIAAAAAAAVAGFRHSSRLDRRRLLLWILLPFVLAAAVYALFSAGTPAATLRQEGWLTFLFLPPEFRSVYASFSGLDRPAFRLAELALAVIVLSVAAACVLAAAFLSSKIVEVRRRRVAAGGALLILAVCSAIALNPSAALEDSISLIPPLVRPLPLLIMFGALWRLVERIRGRDDQGVFATVPDEALLLSAYFASRLILTAGYGGPYAAFYLPLAAVIGITALLRFAESLARRTGLPTLPGLAAGALAIFLVFRVAALTATYRRFGWSRLDTPAGPLLLPKPYAAATRDTVAELARRTSPDGPIVGFPEIGFLQYVLGRTNPLAQDQFFPGHLDRAAEAEAIARIERRLPQAFVYVNVLTIGHGAFAFGSDYLQDLDATVRRLSRPAVSIGPGARPEERIGDPGFFIEIRAPGVRAQ